MLKMNNILIIGSASPEGKGYNNIKLAESRADKIYSYIRLYVNKDKIIINNDYNLFISKTGVNRNDYKKLRAVYIEIILKNKTEEPDIIEDEQKEIEPQRDTIYKTDTLYISKIDKDKLVLSVYNSLSEDLIMRPNIGVEVYFHQMSWFIDGSFSTGTVFGKKYDIDFWHTGFRKYFNDRYDKIYIELYGRAGWFDTDLFSKDDNGVFGLFFGTGLGIGYKFNICNHWKITPNIRFGFDNFKFNNYYRTNGGLDVDFGTYINGKTTTKEDTQTINKNGDVVYWNDKTINKDFFNNSYNMFWFGPTYIGVTIQRDFYIHKK